MEDNMELKCVVAIVRPEVLKILERRLGAVHVHGLTVTRVRGFGTHPNLFADDWTTEHIKIEIFIECESVDALVATFAELSHTGSTSDGVVAVHPVEKFLRLRGHSDSTP
jgi:nitrogen regulatory protein PII